MRLVPPEELRLRELLPREELPLRDAPLREEPLRDDEPLLRDPLLPEPEPERLRLELLPDEPRLRELLPDDELRLREPLLDERDLLPERREPDDPDDFDRLLCEEPEPDRLFDPELRPALDRPGDPCLAAC